MKKDFELNLKKLKTSNYDLPISSKIYKEVCMNNKRINFNKEVKKEVNVELVRKGLDEYLKNNIDNLTKQFEKILNEHKVGFISTILKREKEKELEYEIESFRKEYIITKQLEEELEYQPPYIRLMDKFQDAIVANFKKQEMKKLGKENIEKRDELVDGLHNSIGKDENETFRKTELFQDLVGEYQSDEDFARSPFYGIEKFLLKKENREALKKYYFEMFENRYNKKTDNDKKEFENEYLQEALFDKNSMIFIELRDKIQEDLLGNFAPEPGKRYGEYSFKISDGTSDMFGERIGSNAPIYNVEKEDLKLSEEEFIEKVKKEIEKHDLHLYVLDYIGKKELIDFINKFSGGVDEEEVYRQLKEIVLETAISDREYDLEELADEEEDELDEKV